SPTGSVSERKGRGRHGTALADGGELDRTRARVRQRFVILLDGFLLGHRQQRPVPVRNGRCGVCASVTSGDLGRALSSTEVLCYGSDMLLCRDFSDAGGPSGRLASGYGGAPLYQDRQQK